MAEALAHIVKVYLVPGSMSLLLLGTTLGVVLLLSGRAGRVAGRVLLVMLTALYWTLSLPVVADLLATRFGASPLATSAAPPPACDALLVLGAGAGSLALHGAVVTLPDRQTVFNAFEGARLFKALPARVPVVASGGVVNEQWQKQPESVVIRDLLVRAGVPESSITLDSLSTTTHEQGVNLSELSRRQQWRHPCVVAPAVQMPRALASFRREGVAAIPVDAPFRADDGGESGARWVPSGDALEISARALYDYLAWAYYRMRGWLA